MVNAYRLSDAVLREDSAPGSGPPPYDPVWIDLVAPTPDERRTVEHTYGVTLPDDAEIEEIEASSRHFQDRGIHLRSLFMADVSGLPRLTPVAFQVEADRVYSLRSEPLDAFAVYVAEATRTAGLAKEPLSILLGLFEAKIDRVADVLERLLRDLDASSEAARAGPDERSLEDMVSALGTIRDANDRVRLVLMDDERALSFLLRRGLVPADGEALLREILRDVDSLAAHSNYLFERVDSLLRDTFGRVGIEQSKIIKIFSVMAVALLPPTLIASLYGMNFRFMPELEWRWGYPLALVAMLVSGLGPFWYFKRRGWL